MTIAEKSYFRALISKMFPLSEIRVESQSSPQNLRVWMLAIPR